MIVVMKKDDMPRICIDYRKLNEKTRKDNYPLALIDEMVNKLIYFPQSIYRQDIKHCQDASIPMTTFTDGSRHSYAVQIDRPASPCTYITPLYD